MCARTNINMFFRSHDDHVPLGWTSAWWGCSEGVICWADLAVDWWHAPVITIRCSSIFLCWLENSCCKSWVRIIDLYSFAEAREGPWCERLAYPWPCQVCLDEPARLAFVPCGHLASCEDRRGSGKVARSLHVSLYSSQEDSLEELNRFYGYPSSSWLIFHRKPVNTVHVLFHVPFASIFQLY